MVPVPCTKSGWNVSSNQEISQGQRCQLRWKKESLGRRWEGTGRVCVFQFLLVDEKGYIFLCVKEKELVCDRETSLAFRGEICRFCLSVQ